MDTIRLFSRTAFFGIAATAWLVAVDVSAQSERVDLLVNDPRPVAEALLELARRYPAIVTYEDPRYVYSGDILDVTDKVRRNPANAASRTLVPRGGEIQVSYDVARDTGQPADFANTLASIVEVNNLNPVGGRFGLRREGDVFHVVPVAARDSQGLWIKQASILDTPISLSTEELNGYQLTEAILLKVSEGNGVQVGLAVERFGNAFMHYTGRVDAANEPARDVLLRTLHSISERFTYHLLYDPSGKYYVLGAHLAAEPPVDFPLDLSIIPRPGDPSPAGPAVR